MHSVVTALHAHDVAPALDWAATHGHVLRRNGRTSALEFTLYKLQFLDTVQRVRAPGHVQPCKAPNLHRPQEGRNAAVKYARAHFRDLDASHVRPARLDTGPERNQGGGKLVCCLLMLSRMLCVFRRAPRRLRCSA